MLCNGRIKDGPTPVKAPHTGRRLAASPPSPPPSLPLSRFHPPPPPSLPTHCRRRRRRRGRRTHSSLSRCNEHDTALGSSPRLRGTLAWVEARDSLSLYLSSIASPRLGRPIPRVCESSPFPSCPPSCRKSVFFGAHRGVIFFSFSLYLQT